MVDVWYICPKCPSKRWSSSDVRDEHMRKKHGLEFHQRLLQKGHWIVTGGGRRRVIAGDSKVNWKSIYATVPPPKVVWVPDRYGKMLLRKVSRSQ